MGAIRQRGALGHEGSERGAILRDEEYISGSRITLERDTQRAPFTITCGVYGWMLHTRFFRGEAEALDQFEPMKIALAEIVDSLPRSDDENAEAKTDWVSDALVRFIEEYP